MARTTPKPKPRAASKQLPREEEEDLDVSENEDEDLVEPPRATTSQRANADNAPRPPQKQDRNLQPSRKQDSQQSRKPSPANLPRKGKAKDAAPPDEEQDVDEPPTNGKAKPGPSRQPNKRTQPREAPLEPVDNDDDDMSVDNPPPVKGRTAASARPQQSSRPRPSPDGQVDTSSNAMVARLERELEQQRAREERMRQRLEAQNERLREENDALRKEHDELSDKFNLLHRLRTTEAEEAREGLKAIADSTAADQAALIAELESQINGLDELTAEGATRTLRLLTREETDGRFKELKAALLRKDSDLKESLAKTRELTELVGTLQSDLAQEKEHFAREQNRLTVRQATVSSSPLNNRSATTARDRPLGERQPQLSSECVSFLEDMCGCGILHAVAEPRDKAAGGGVTWRFRCIFTINEEESLTFDISIPPAPTSSDEGSAVQSEVMFTPLLDAGPTPSPEFLEKLAFLSSSFTFPRAQMSMLTKALLDLLPAGDAAEEDDDDDDESMVVDE